MRATLALAAALAASPALGQPALGQTEEPRATADRLVRTLAESGAGAFFDLLLSDTGLGNDAAARRDIVEGRARRVRELESFGVLVDQGYVGARHYAPSLRTLCYAVRYRRQPLLVSLRFYDTGRGWELLTYAYHSHGTLQNWECAGAAPFVADPSATPAMGKTP